MEKKIWKIRLSVNVSATSLFVQLVGRWCWWWIWVNQKKKYFEWMPIEFESHNKVYSHICMFYRIIINNLSINRFILDEWTFHHYRLLIERLVGSQEKKITRKKTHCRKKKFFDKIKVEKNFFLFLSSCVCARALQISTPSIYSFVHSFIHLASYELYILQHH